MVAHLADGEQPRPANRERRRAAGIYGAIVTAAILAAVGGRLPTAALVVSVVVTLLVYWVAEEYAELLGEQVSCRRGLTSEERWPRPGRWSARPSCRCWRWC